jgi:CP family cyanate transporter-like MFS transporter
MAQSIGYCVAAAGAFAVGALEDWSGDWNLPLAVLIGLTFVLVVAGLGAGRDGYVSAGDTAAP